MMEAKNDDIRDIDKQMRNLQGRRDTLANRCQHHFIPCAPVNEVLKCTRVPDVYDAGEIGETTNVSAVTFEIVCEECLETRTKPLTEQCPVCLGQVVGELGDGSELDEYFGPSNHGFYAAYHIRCPSCGFNAVGIQWDQ